MNRYLCKNILFNIMQYSLNDRILAQTLLCIAVWSHYQTNKNLLSNHEVLMLFEHGALTWQYLKGVMSCLQHITLNSIAACISASFLFGKIMLTAMTLWWCLKVYKLRTFCAEKSRVRKRIFQCFSCVYTQFWSESGGICKINDYTLTLAWVPWEMFKQIPLDWANDNAWNNIYMYDPYILHVEGSRFGIFKIIFSALCDYFCLSIQSRPWWNAAFCLLM